MKKFLAVALAVAGVSVAHAKTMPVGVAARAEATVNAVCAGCHGVDGNGLITVNPRLAGQNAKYLYKQMQDFKSGKRDNGIMKAQVAGLTDQNMADLAAYFSSQKAVVITPAKPDTVAAGEKLYRGGDGSRGVVPCAGCHAPNGKGNLGAVYPKIGGQHPDYVKAQLKAFRAAGREDIGAVTRTNDAAKAGEKGPMQQVASKLSDQDIEKLANFIGALH